MIEKYCIDKIKDACRIDEVIGGYIELKKNGANLICLSPFSNEKSPSFTVSPSKNIYKCFSTGKSGDAINFLMEYKKINYIEAIKLLADKYQIEIVDDKENKKPKYFKPIWKNNTFLSDKLVKWFESERKVTQTTLEAFKISEGCEWMPNKKKGVGGQINTIQFNYFLDGELINTKFRDSDKNFKLVKDAELILYNLDAIKDFASCVIVEGEMDALAMFEAGYKNVISVPNGATKGTNNLSYLDNSIQYLEHIKEFYLALDNDENGNKLKEEIARRLGYENCKTVTFKDSKDANDCLIKYGKQTIINCINEAKEFPIVGVFNALDIEANIYDFYNNGLPKGAGINMAEIDTNIKFHEGYLTIITGIPGHGKSEFLDFILCRLNISHNWKTGLYSPENHPLELHFSKFAEKIVGKPFEGSHKMSPTDLRMMIDYHADNFFFINPKENFTLDTILDATKQLVRKKGIKAFVIDAWNKLDHQYTGNEGQYISKELDKIVNFCERNKIHCFLVAHPTKMLKDKKTNLFEVPSLYSINGSSHFYNKAANGITVYRNFETGLTEIHIQKVKFKHWGQSATVHLAWNRDNGRYYKGTPNNDNWIYSEQPKQIENNTNFLDEKTNDLIFNAEDKTIPF